MSAVDTTLDLVARALAARDATVTDWDASGARCYPPAMHIAALVTPRYRRPRDLDPYEWGWQVRSRTGEVVATGAAADCDTAAAEADAALARHLGR